MPLIRVGSYCRWMPFIDRRPPGLAVAAEVGTGRLWVLGGEGPAILNRSVDLLQACVQRRDEYRVSMKEAYGEVLTQGLETLVRELVALEPELAEDRSGRDYFWRGAVEGFSEYDLGEPDYPFPWR